MDTVQVKAEGKILQVLSPVGDGRWLPLGMIFSPTEEEIVCEFLLRKLKNQQLTPNPIHEVNLYSFPTPHQLTEKFKGVRGKWYFFTPITKKYQNGDRPDWSTPGGYWRATGADINIISKGHIVGTKKVLCFYVGAAMAGTKTDWIMHEYRIKENNNNANSNDMRLDKWVLCKVYHKETGKKKRNNEGAERNPPQPNVTAINQQEHDMELLTEIDEGLRRSERNRRKPRWMEVYD